MSLAVIIPMRRLAAAIVATTLPALPATAHTGTPQLRGAVAGGIAPALPGVASEITSPDRTMEGSRPVTVAQSHPSTNPFTLRASQVTGRNEIVVDGTAPAALPVRIYLTGEISRDIPVVTLYGVTLATDGTFHAVLPIAPSMPRDSVVIVTATSLSGASLATARVVVGAPNPQLDTRFDHLDPKD